MVYVISKEGKPLMPTKRHGKLRRLLKRGLAKVVRIEPFTIQLLYDTTNFVQPVTVGLKIGSKIVGISAVTEKQEIFSAEVQLRQDIKKLLFKRKLYRKNRRYRKKRYRKARFLNRRKPEGWITPSIKWKIDAHTRLLNYLAKILPIGKIVVETAYFDIGKKVSSYTNKNLKVREKSLKRAGYKSELSGKDGKLQIHHIVPKIKGGTDNQSNLIVVTKDEHKSLHEGKIKILKSRYRKIKFHINETHISIISSKILKKLKEKYDVETTSGKRIKELRTKVGLEKTPRNDAFLTASKGVKIKRVDEWYFGKFFRRQDRSLHKVMPGKNGKRRRNTLKQAFGFNKYDKVEYKGKIWIIKSLRTRGYFVIGSLSDNNIKIEDVKYDKLKLIEKGKTLMFEKRK